MRLRLASYNIRHGGIGRVTAIAATLRACDADLVVLQEAVEPNVVTQVAERCGYGFHASRPRHSVAVMSRVALGAVAWVRPRFAKRAFVHVDLDGGHRVFGVHLSAVHANWTERRRHYELRQLLAVIASQARGFHVLTGDFNTLAPGELLDASKLPHRLRTLVWLSGGRIRWRTIHALLEAGYSDGFRLVHPEADGLTFPTWDPQLRLDYVFLPEPDASRLVDCRVVRDVPEARDASDHFPLVSDLEFP